jgi:hypothetical protein
VSISLVPSTSFNHPTSTSGLFRHNHSQRPSNWSRWSSKIPGETGSMEEKENTYAEADYEPSQRNLLGSRCATKGW